MTGTVTPLQQDPTDLREYGWHWFQDIINRMIEAFRTKLVSTYQDVGGTFETGTPVPGDGLGDPSQMFSGSGLNATWESIYEGTVPSGSGVPEMFALGLMVLAAAVQARHFAQIFSSGTAYQAHKTRKSAWIGGALILVWYWLAVMGLSLVNVFHEGIVEQFLNGFTFGGTLEIAVQSVDIESANRAWLFPLFALAAVCTWGVEAVLYLRHELLIQLFVYVMPVLIAMIYGNVPVVEGIARTLAEKFVSLLVLPIPLVLVMWGYETIVTNHMLGGSFENAVLAASFPVVAAYVVWKVMTYEYPSGDRITAAAAAAGTAAGAAVGSATGHGPQVATERVPAETPAEPAAEPIGEERPSFRRAPPYERW